MLLYLISYDARYWAKFGGYHQLDIHCIPSSSRPPPASRHFSAAYCRQMSQCGPFKFDKKDS